MFRLFGFGLLACSLIYGWSIDIHLSASEKLATAFPVNSHITSSLENIRAISQSTKTSLSEFNKVYAKKLKYRSLGCLKDLSASRFDSLDTIKKLQIDTNCLLRKDEELLQYIGMQQVAIRLKQPPLRPQVKLGEKTEIKLQDVWATQGVYSLKSGVAVFANQSSSTSGRKILISYDIKEKRNIVELKPIQRININSLSLSPNGRVVTVTAGKGHGGDEVVFLDTETGNELARIEQSLGVEAWLPNMSAALLKHNMNTTLRVANFDTGKISPYKISDKVQHWVATIGGSSSRFLVGGDKKFFIVEHIRNGNSVEPKIIKEFNPKRYGYNKYDPLTVMLNGQVAIDINKFNFIEYDLVNGGTKSVNINTIMKKKFYKLSEQELLVTLENKSEPYVYNVKKGTLSSSNENISRRGSISKLNGRNGFLRRESLDLWIGESFNVGASFTLDSLITKRKNDQILKRALDLEREQRESEIFGAPVRRNPTPALAFSTKEIRQGRAVSRSMKSRFPSSPHPVPNSIGKRSKQKPKDELYKSRRIGSSLVPENIKVELISVTRAKNSTSKEIYVTVKKTKHPVFLVLASCSAGLKWKIIKLPGSRLLNTFQHVKPVQPLPRIIMDDSIYRTNRSLSGSKTGRCLTKPGTPEYAALDKKILKLVGKPIGRSQFVTQGSAFTIGD